LRQWLIYAVCRVLDILMPFQPRYVAKVAKAAKFVNKNKYICESLQAYAPQSRKK